MSTAARRAAALVAALIVAPVPAAAQWELPPGVTPDGVLAVSADALITVHELADAWAPILWFSDHEPLLEPWEPLPSALPTDPASPVPGRGVVYYRATVVSPKAGPGLLASQGIETEAAGPELFTPWDPATPCAAVVPFVDPDPDCIHLDRVGLIRLQYLFYFENDVGGGGHSHDLEIAELWFSVEPVGNLGFHKVRLEEVVGYAHGHKGLANKLDLGDGAPDDPLSLPLVLLIERGKHAPAPDRTGDGSFSPGFDVNRMVSDAWGVRDVFGSSWYGGRAYASWMTLGRDGQKRARPLSAGAISTPSEWPYELRDFAVAAAAAQSLDPTEELYIYLDYHGYDRPPQNGGTHLFTFFENFGAGARIDLGLGPYVSWMSPELPYIGGHLVATGMVGLTFAGYDPWYGGSALYSPSIAGFYNVYAGASWLQCPSCTSGTGFGPEAGLKFRVPIPHPPAPDFLGLRVGLRYDSFTNMGSPRLLLEIGLATP